MTRIMMTNEEIDDMFDNPGENYINGFYLRKYELKSTDIIEPINPLTRRQRNTQKKRYVLLLYQYRIRSVTKNIPSFNIKKALCKK